MTFKLAILSVIVSSLLICQHADSLFVGKWIYVSSGAATNQHRAIDIWTIHQHSYEDTLYHVFPDGSKEIAVVAHGTWFVRKDTLFTSNTLIQVASGHAIYSEKIGIVDGDKILSIDTTAFVLDTPVGVRKYSKQK